MFAEEMTKSLALRRRIRDVLREGAMTNRQIGERVGADLTSVNVELYQLWTRCEVVREERAIWRCPRGKNAKYLWRLS